MGYRTRIPHKWPFFWIILHFHNRNEYQLSALVRIALFRFILVDGTKKKIIFFFFMEHSKKGVETGSSRLFYWQIYQ